jgi:hypothetical protein
VREEIPRRPGLRSAIEPAKVPGREFLFPDEDPDEFAN